MRYYSDTLKRLFDTEKELNAAEDRAKKEAEEKARKEKTLKEQRAARAKEIEEAYASIGKAKKHYYDLIEAFCKDYGSYHQSVSSSELTDWPFSLWF